MGMAGYACGVEPKRKGRSFGARGGLPLVLLLLGALAASGLVASTAGAGEPDNSTGEAGGPLASGVAVEGDMALQDRDFYFFYVTAPEGAALEIVATNLGGGTSGADFDVAIEDAAGTAITKESFIRPGEERRIAPTLAPGKYFVEIAPNLGVEERYRLTPGGGTGAFGAYAEISARCATARAGVSAVKAKVGKAEGRLQRAVAKRRRSRFASKRARLRARRGQARAARRLRAVRRKLRTAHEGLEPWCSIPE